MGSDATAAARAGEAPAVAQRFAVAWRDAQRRRIVPVGILEADGERATFRYVAGVRSDPQFRPLPAFPDLGRVYEQDFLFPFFEHRAIDPDRPDYDDYVTALGLHRGATAWDILARSGGRRAGDKIQMQVAPQVDPSSGATTCTFLVRGLQFVPDPAAADAAISRLRPGTALGLTPDEDNPVNDEALLVTTGDGVTLGWVPELLVDYANVARRHDVRLTVVRSNPPSLPAHLRLLVRLDGHVPPPYQAFAGPQWQPLVDASAVH